MISRRARASHGGASPRCGTAVTPLIDRCRNCVHFMYRVGRPSAAAILPFLRPSRRYGRTLTAGRPTLDDALPKFHERYITITGNSSVALAPVYAVYCPVGNPKPAAAECIEREGWPRRWTPKPADHASSRPVAYNNRYQGPRIIFRHLDGDGGRCTALRKIESTIRWSSMNTRDIGRRKDTIELSCSNQTHRKSAILYSIIIMLKNT